MKGEMGNEIEVMVRRKFGDEQSNLLDKFERLSFEVQLNRAMLGRSLSEPGTIGRHHHHRHPKLLPFQPQPQPAASATSFLASSYQSVATPPALVSQVSQGRRGRTGFQRVVKKLLKPIFGFRRRSSNNGGGTAKNHNHNIVPDPKDPRFWKAFSRSLRF